MNVIPFVRNGKAVCVTCEGKGHTLLKGHADAWIGCAFKIRCGLCYGKGYRDWIDDIVRPLS